MKNADDQLPSFLVVQFETIDRSLSSLEDDQLADHAQRLSSKIMRWSPGVWILDLNLYRSYWNNQSRKHQCSTTSLIEAVLNKISRELGGSVQVRGALAWHPWQALLLVSQMQDRRLLGLISASLPLGRKLLQQLTWSALWRMTDQLASHQWGGVLKRAKFDRSIYFQQKLKFERTVKRLGLVSPEQLSQIEPLAIKRRFGSFFYDVWQWLYGQRLYEERPYGEKLYGEKLHGESRSVAQTSLFAKTDFEHDGLINQRSNCGQFACGFPWQSWSFKNLPQVERHMDDPIYEWAHMESLLQEDFNYLCDLSLGQVEERVVSLEWNIVFQDMTSLHIPIYFRNPHCLHAERPTQRTALLQAQYAFLDAVPGSQLDRKERLKEHLPMLCVASWKLVLKERLKATSIDQVIFKEEQQGFADDYCTINYLENKLRVPLDHYELKEDWLPEDAFASRFKLSNSHSVEISNSHLEDARPTLNAVGKHRPLYLYRQPMVFRKEETTLQVDFCERTMNKWWSSIKSSIDGNPHSKPTEHSSDYQGKPNEQKAYPAQVKLNTDRQMHYEKAGSSQSEERLTTPTPLGAKIPGQQRNYFKVTDHKRRRFWVFQDEQGQWYVHGVFS